MMLKRVEAYRQRNWRLSFTCLGSQLMEQVKVNRQTILDNKLSQSKATKISYPTKPEVRGDAWAKKDKKSQAKKPE